MSPPLTESQGVESKWTPGPWRPYVDEDGNVISVLKHVKGDSGGTTGKGICRMPIPVYRGPKTTHSTWDEINANAQLIMAAPDLLAALKALQLQALQSPDLLRTEWGKEALDLTRAAIAKAEGQ